MRASGEIRYSDSLLWVDKTYLLIYKYKVFIPYMDLLIQQVLKSLQTVPEQYRESAFPLLLNHVLTTERVILMHPPKKRLER